MYLVYSTRQHEGTTIPLDVLRLPGTTSRNRPTARKDDACNADAINIDERCVCAARVRLHLLVSNHVVHIVVLLAVINEIPTALLRAKVKKKIYLDAENEPFFPRAEG